MVRTPFGENVVLHLREAAAALGRRRRILGGIQSPVPGVFTLCSDLNRTCEQ